MANTLIFMRRNAIALLALFVALGGTSYAALNLPAGSVGTRQLHNGAVTGKKLANGSVGPAKFDGRAIGGSVRHWAHVSQTARVLGGSNGARASGGPSSASVGRSVLLALRCRRDACRKCRRLADRRYHWCGRDPAGDGAPLDGRQRHYLRGWCGDRGSVLRRGGVLRPDNGAGLPSHRMSSRRRTIGGVMVGVSAAALKLAASASALGVVWIHACGSWTPAISSAGGRVGVAPRDPPLGFGRRRSVQRGSSVTVST